MSIRVQTTKSHFDLFLPAMNVRENVFSSEREFKKALRDTLMRAAWYELLSTMANCGKIVTFLCLGCFYNHLSNYTKTIIRLRLVNIKHLMTGPEGNKIHCSPRDQSLSDLVYSKTKQKQNF